MMKPSQVYAAKAMIERRHEILGYLDKIKNAKSVMIEIEPTFRLEMTIKSTQDLIDRICKQYIDELNKLEAELEHMGVEPD